MRLREAALDLGYFFLTLFLVTYGLVLVVRGYVAGSFSRRRASADDGS